MKVADNVSDIKKQKHKFSLEITGKNSAYLRLPNHPEILRNARTVTLVDAIGAYNGPYIVFDFNEDNVLIGIEILVEEDGDDEEEEGVMHSDNK